MILSRLTSLYIGCKVNRSRYSTVPSLYAKHKDLPRGTCVMPTMTLSTTMESSFLRHKGS